MEKADRQLYNGLLKFCFPKGIKEVWRSGYQKLLESDGRSGVPISRLYQRKSSEHIDACLPFLPLYLYGCKCYSRRVIENEDVCHWLDQNPPILKQLNHCLGRVE